MDFNENDFQGVLSLVDLTVLDPESLVIGDPDGDHWHWDKIEEFYNHCHGKGGLFCPTGGGSGSGGEGKNRSGETGAGSSGSKAGKTGSLKQISGETSLRDGDGTGSIHEGTAKRGKHGGSLVDPNLNTKSIDGISGYDAKGKPVPGSNAWLEAHGLSKSVFQSRPYVKYEANKNDAALREGYKDYPKAEKFFTQRAEQTGQSGGYLMYKHEVPGSPWGKIAPQARPNHPIITDMAKYSYAKKVYENDQARLAILKKTTPATLLSERRAQLKQAELHLERTKTATPEKIKAEADKNLANAHTKLEKAKTKGDPVAIIEAKKALISEKRQHIKDYKSANNWRPDKNLHDAETAVKYAQNRLAHSKADPASALADEVKAQGRRVDRSKNRFDKTSAKYVFPPGTSSARIDMNPDPQNVKNLTEGKGRIYFAMEGSIKADAILMAAKKEDPTAAVVNVPSVTLWQQKAGLPGEATGEVMWFAKKFGKGREIILIPDADGANNPNVMMQAKALSTALKTSGAGHVILAAPPLKAGTKKQIDHFNLPSGIDEGRKGIDDHLGAGRGQLSQLQYSNTLKVPKYDLSWAAKAAGGKDANGETIKTGSEATRSTINHNSIKNTEAALAAISGIAGPGGVTRMPKKMLAQTANLPHTSALEARNRLVDLGIIKVEHIFDEGALSRGRRIRNPKVSEERIKELVKQGVIKEPRLDEPFTEVSIEESPVVTILDKRYVIKPENVETGTLGDLNTWHPPKSYKGWTSPVNGARDTTGIASKLINEEAKATTKKTVTTADRIAAAKKAAPGQRIVRTQAGAKKYGVSIGQPIPVATSSETINLESSSVSFDSLLTSLVLIPEDIMEEKLEQFYNHHHGKDGKFAPGGGSGGTGSGSKGSGNKDSGSGGSGPGSKGSGKEGDIVITAARIAAVQAAKGYRLVKGSKPTGSVAKGWPDRNGRPVKTIVRAKLKGSIEVDGIKARAVYEVTTNNGAKIRLYDKTGLASKHANALLQTQARMHEMYPLNPPRNIVVSRPSGLFKERDIPAHVIAVVHSGVNPTFVNVNSLGRSIGKSSLTNHFMPSSRTGDTKNLDYILTHEYGHQQDFAVNYKGGKYKESPLLQKASFKNNLSTYGHRNNIEAYAEAFAEWHYTDGKTTNPAAVALARSEGWHGTSIRASGVEEFDGFGLMSLTAHGLIQFNEGDLMNFAVSGNNIDEVSDEEIDADIPSFDHIPGIFVADTTGEEPTVSGDYEIIKPSEKEITDANQLMDEVLQELGLNSNGEKL